MKSIEKNSYILYNNKIKDINSLKNLVNIEYLGLNYNKIKDVEVLQNLKNLKMSYMKSKRILALTGAVILITLYVSSIIFALMDSPLAENLLLASLFCTIVIPAVLYGYAVALRYFKKKK